MPFYESTFIARQDISVQDVEKLTQQFSKHITDGGGKVVKHEYWGLRDLAYEINKNRKGHYVMLGLDTEPAALKEMERNIGLHEDVIRNVTFNVEQLDEDQSPMLQSRSDKDDRYDDAASDDF